MRILHEPYSESFDKWHLNHTDLPSAEFPPDCRPVIHRIGVDRGTPHDHPFALDLWIMRTGYEEEHFWQQDGVWRRELLIFPPFTARHIPARHVHRVTRLLGAGPCLTIALYGKPDGEWRYYPEALADPGSPIPSQGLTNEQ